MIRDGKAAGWLKLPPEALLPWAMLNDVSFKSVVPGVSVGKGGALLASNALPGDDEQGKLMNVPHDLILSLDRMLEHAKVDKDFREVLEAVGDFGRVGRFPHLFASFHFPVDISCSKISWGTMYAFESTRQAAADADHYLRHPEGPF